MNAKAETTPGPVLPTPVDLALLADFAAGATHMLASPIGALLANVEIANALAQRPDGATRLPEVIERMRHETLRCHALLARMRDLVNAVDELRVRRVARVADLCRSGIDAAIGNAACRPEQVEFVEYDPSPPAWLLPDTAVVRAVEGLVRNAAEAGASNIHVSLAHDAHASLVCVRDDGPGIPDALLPRVAEPFFRAGKPDGLGVGLWLADRVATSCGGSLSVENHPGGGSVVCLRLPHAA